MGLLPDDTAPNEIFLSYFDEVLGEWVFAGGNVDLEREVIAIEVDHASRWSVTTWNWDAWIAVLNGILTGGWVDSTQVLDLLTTECVQETTFVRINLDSAKSLVQGCVVVDGKKPTLNVLNPKSFYYEVSVLGRDVAGFPQVLSPGEVLEFGADTNTGSPLTVEARLTTKTMVYTQVHNGLILLPGVAYKLNLPDTVKCISEDVKIAALLFQAAEALLVDQDGLAAAELATRAYLDEVQLQRLLERAGICGLDVAATWTVKDITTVFEATGVITSQVDFLANYLVGNSPAHVLYFWNQPTPPPSASPSPDSATPDLQGLQLLATGMDWSGNKGLFLIGPQAEGPVRVYLSDTFVHLLEIGPEGTRAFFADQSGGYVISALTGTFEYKFFASGYVADFTVANRGRVIGVLSSANQGMGDWKIEEFDPLYSLLASHVVSFAGFDLGSAIRPDPWELSDYIAFTSGVNCAGIWLHNIHSDSATPITEMPSGPPLSPSGYCEDARLIDWLPDGSGLLFVSSGNQILSYDPLSGTRTLLIKQADSETVPYWARIIISSDGRYVYYFVERESGEVALVRILTDGSQMWEELPFDLGVVTAFDVDEHNQTLYYVVSSESDSFVCVLSFLDGQRSCFDSGLKEISEIRWFPPWGQGN